MAGCSAPASFFSDNKHCREGHRFSGDARYNNIGEGRPRSEVSVTGG